MLILNNLIICVFIFLQFIHENLINFRPFLSSKEKNSEKCHKKQFTIL